MSEQDLILAGKSALNVGNKAKAANIFAQLVKQYPNSEQGWMLLANSVSDAKQRDYCLRRVLAINPNNIDARNALAPLTSPPFDSSPSTFDSPQPFQPNTSAPFIIDETEEKIEKQKTQRRKKDQKIIQNTMIMGGVVILCTLIVALIILLGLPNNLFAPKNLPPSSLTAIPLAPTWTPTVFVEANKPLPTPMPTLAYTPTFAESACPFETPNGIRVTCGYVSVPESRANNPTDMIRLAVAVFHSTSSNPNPDPILFLQGGPGGAAVELSAAGYEVVVEPFISERDFVVFDQRGTGLSTPALKCDELDKVYFQDIYGTIEDSTRELVYQNALFSCGGFHRSNGINLPAYNTVENAADLKDVVQLLGYEKVNLFGVSYGTRLSLVTMRNHPEIVRSAILDSVVPVETNVIHAYPDSVRSALAKTFETCMVDVQCNAAYPELEKVFWELVNQLDERPITLTTSAYPIGTVTETINGDYLLSVVLGLSRNDRYINTIPQTIYRLKNGDYTTLTLAQYSLPYIFDGVNPALYISTMCREHVLASSEEQLQQVSESLGLDSLNWRPFYGGFPEMYDACKTWGATGPDLGENDAVVSDIPSIIIEGSYDPATPPFMGKQAAQNLANSFYFEFPNAGHVPSLDDPEGCAMQVVLEFLKNPLVEPNRQCVSEIPAVKYLVPYTGEPAIELETVNTLGVRVKVPKDWYDDFGVFVRYSSPFDATQVVAFRDFISVQELNEYFSASIYGYRGLDGAPTEAGVLQFNGLTWKLYFSTSNGRPVDIAAAEDGSTSIIIMMITHPDEHDAFYRTLFLPMIESAR